jgi:hypothetical protein
MSRWWVASLLISLFTSSLRMTQMVFMSFCSKQNGHAQNNTAVRATYNIYKAVSCAMVREIPSLDKYSSTCRVFWDDGQPGGGGVVLMTDRTCVCSGEQSKVEEESVGGQIRQSERLLASSAVRRGSVARSLHVGRHPFPLQWIRAMHATCSISGQLTWWLETPTLRPSALNNPHFNAIISQCLFLQGCGQSPCLW